MFNKFEIIGAGICVASMGLALYLVQVNTIIGTSTTTDAVAAVSQPGVVIVAQGDELTANRVNAYVEAADARGNIKDMVIDDIKIGTGDEAQTGDTVAVHYIGTLQAGQEFDNSRKRGQPFEFTLGENRVIEGWEKGVLGMKVGGQRILVVPPEMAYGENGVGPIPANATLVFAIELLEIK